MDQILTNSAYSPTTASAPGTRMERVLVDGDIASEWLKRNSHNRPLRKQYVRELRRDLDEGRWDDRTHQGIAFAPDGTLLDGQHRLSAIAEGTHAVWMWVSYDVPPETFKVIDQGLRRTGGQILAMSGVTKDAPRLVAMARAILSVVCNHPKATNTEAADYVVQHQTELELFLPVSRQYTPAVGAAFAWCAILGWSEVLPAAERLLSTIWEDPADMDPMRALHQRARNFSDLGQGQAGVKGRFDIALKCLEAVHEHRGLKVAKSYRPDYGRLERESSMAPKSAQTLPPVAFPPAPAVPVESTVLPKQDDIPTYLKRRAKDSEVEQLEASRGGNIDDPELTAAIEAEVAKGRRSRKSDDAH